MAEQKLQTRTRRRRVTTSVSKSSLQSETKLKEAMDESISIQEEISALQGQLADQYDIASELMTDLNISKFTSGRANAVYDHPAQKTTNSFDTQGLFESVTIEDFVASVKIQKTLAVKVIDPKILTKYTTATKSALKPKTLKLTSKK